MISWVWLIPAIWLSFCAGMVALGFLGKEKDEDIWLHGWSFGYRKGLTHAKGQRKKIFNTESASSHGNVGEEKIAIQDL